MRKLWISMGVGFALTVVAFAVIADNSFWSPAVGTAKAPETTDKAESLSLTDEPGLQKKGAKNTEAAPIRRVADKRTPQNDSIEESGAKDDSHGAGMTVALHPVKKTFSHVEGTAQKTAAKSALTESATVSKEEDDSRGPRVFSVQIASYKTKEEAESKLAEIKKSGFSGFVLAADVNGTQYFRVRVGPFPSKDEAAGTQTKLASAGEKSTFVTSHHRIQ